MTQQIILVHPSMGDAVRALLEAGSVNAVEMARLPVEPLRLAPEPVYVSPRDYEPRNDVRRLRRQQYAPERRTPPQLGKGKGRR